MDRSNIVKESQDFSTNLLHDPTTSALKTAEALGEIYARKYTTTRSIRRIMDGTIGLVHSTRTTLTEVDGELRMIEGHLRSNQNIAQSKQVYRYQERYPMLSFRSSQDATALVVY